MTITERNGCPVPALNDITDPETLTRFEAVARAGGTPFYTDPDKFHVGNELACVQQGAVSEGGTYKNESAYRPTPYQDHLREVWDKWGQLNELENLYNPACDARRQEVGREIKCPPEGYHCLIHPPAENSNHSDGDAFDLKVYLPPNPVFDREIQAWACGVRQFNPGGDPNHYSSK